MSTLRVAECFDLPSHGKIYEEKINPNIVMGSMKTKHEMLRLSAGEDNKIMASIIDDCIEGDLGISSYDLCLGDFQFLLYKLRIVTFGPEYKITTKCPYCGYPNIIDADLENLPINEYDESLNDLLNITLPVSKNVITLTLQTPRLLDKSQAMVKEYRKRHKETNENPTLLYTILTSIDLIDGEEPNRFTLEEWIKDLPMADTNALIQRIDNINSKIGVDLNVDCNCALCKNDFITPFRLNQSFFRPEVV